MMVIGIVLGVILSGLWSVGAVELASALKAARQARIEVTGDPEKLRFKLSLMSVILAFVMPVFGFYMLKARLGGGFDVLIASLFGGMAYTMSVGGELPDELREEFKAKATEIYFANQR